MPGIHYQPGVEAAPGYRLLELLGRGGFGEVWKAEGPGRITVAVKIIDKVDEKAGRKEFRALKLIKDLRHPNLVSIAGFWLRDSDGQLLDPDLLSDDSHATSDKPTELIIVMDLGEMSLLDRLHECREGKADDAVAGIPLEELFEYMEPAARAIDYLNTRHDIQHRDIKPQNILIVGGSAQVCDFGLASTVSSVRTSMGGAGSLAYMAPEVYCTKRPSRATDQYGLAIAYCELRTGFLPLSDTESYSILDDAKRKGVLDLSRLTPAERPVIAKATAMNGDERYESCIAMVRALRQSVIDKPAPAAAHAKSAPLGDYSPEKMLYRRGGEEIWEAIGPERNLVRLVVRKLEESPETIGHDLLQFIRDVTKRHPQLLELYEFVRLNHQGKVLPARLFDGPNPPPCEKLLLVEPLVGESLAETMGAVGVEPRKLISHMRQLAEAVDFLNAPNHAFGGKQVAILHGELRPVNFHADRSGARIGNFGSTQILEGDEREFPIGRELPAGPYTPPEVAAGKLTRWTDQYLLAVSYLQLRTGKPSSGLTGSGVSRDSDNPAALVSLLDFSGVDEDEETILRRATHPTPSSRFDNCTAMVAELESYWDKAAPAVAPETKKPDDTKSTSKEAIAKTSQFSAVPSDSSPSQTTGRYDQTLVVGESPTESTSAVADRPAPYQGTLAAPQLGDTLVGEDTRMSDLNEPDVPHRRDSTVAPPPAPLPQVARPAWKHPVVLGGGGLLAVAAAVAMFLSKGDDKPPAPKQGGSQIDQLVQENRFQQALEQIDRAELSAAEKQRLEDDILARQYAQAQVQLNATRYADALAELNSLIKRRRPYKDASRLRGEALTQMLRKGISQLETKTDDARKTLSIVIEAIAELSSIPEFARDDQPTVSLARLHRSRAYARLGKTDSARADAAAIRDPFSSPQDKANFAAINVLANDSTLPSEQVRETYQAHVKSFDAWERKELQELIDRIAADEGSAHYKQLSGLFDQIEQNVEKNQLDAAEAALKKIESDKQLKALADGRGKADFDDLTALVLLGRSGAPDADVDRAFDLMRRRIVESTPNQKRLFALCSRLKDRVVERTSAQEMSPRGVALAARALEILAAAKLKAADPAMQDRLGSLTKDLIGPYQADLRSLRDQAGDGGDPAVSQAAWKELNQKCRTAQRLGVAGPLVYSCLAESLLELDNATSDVARFAEMIDAQQADPVDLRYINYATGLAHQAGDDRQKAVAAIVEAWRDQFDPADDQAAATQDEELWQKSPQRRRRAIEILAGAAERAKTGPDHDPSLGANPATANRYSPEAAKQAFAWLALANQLRSGSNLDPKDSADARTIGSVRMLHALSAANGGASDEVARRLTDALIDLKADDESTQLLVANVRLHQKSWEAGKQPKDRDSAVQRYARLLELAEQKYFLDPETTYHQAIEPGVALTAGLEKTADQLSRPTRIAAGRLNAGRGRYIRMFPVIERLFADTGQEVVDSYQTAITFDGEHLRHYVGHALATYELTDATAEEKIKSLGADAKRVAALAKTKEDQSLLAGIGGLALHQESIWNPDYAVKRERLAEAADRFQTAKKYEAPEYKDSEEYQLFLLAEGAVYLHLANYADNQNAKKENLAKAVELAKFVTDEYPSRRHPEWIYQFWGNAEEDHGLFLGDLTGYERGIERFNEGYDLARSQNDPKGMSVALVNRGRCRYRLATATLDKLEAEARASGKRDALDAKRPWAIGQLNTALDDLNRSISTAGNSQLKQAEAHRWIGSIYQNELTQNVEKSLESFALASELAKAKNPSWPFYQVKRGENALQFARVHCDPDKFNRPMANKLLGEAQGAAQSLLDAQNDSRIDSRHRLQATEILTERAIWLGRTSDAKTAYEAALKWADADEKVDLHVAIARQIFEAPGRDNLKRRMTDAEIELAQSAISAAAAGSPSIKDRVELYRVNDGYCNYWESRVRPLAEQFSKDRSGKAELSEVVRYCVFHLDVGVRLQESPEWKKAGLKTNEKLKAGLESYRLFLKNVAGS